MLQVSLDIVPHGIADLTKGIGKLQIINTRPMGGDRCDYVVILDGKELGKISGFLRSAGPWTLVEEAVGLIPDELRSGL